MVARETREPTGIPTANRSHDPPGNLPVQLNTFIGREMAIAEVQRLLGTSRLVTLTGPGGCGKSRLALQVASEIAPVFPDGARWIELAALTEPALLPQIIARSLGIPDEPGTAPLDALLDVLRSRRMLLVLDNCEHLIDAAARLVESLLATCPMVHLLMTSREALNIAGETAWFVPPLSLPAATDADVDIIGRSDAVRLFLDRAIAVAPSLSMTGTNASTLAQICRRLDGIPLAIELAAARAKVLAPDQIAARLDDCFRLLTSGRRTALPRHQTLRATVDWSHDLLTERERILFRRLSVFAGGFTLDAAESICGGDAIDPTDVLDLLSRLVDKSLVIVDVRAGATRYRMLGAIRQYGTERLAAVEEAEHVFRRFRDWLLVLAEAGAELEDATQGSWLERYDAEYDNLRAVLRWAIAEGDPEVAARLGGALWRFWLIRGYLSEGIQWLEAALARHTEPTAVRAKALMAAAVLTTHVCDYDRAVVLFTVSLDIAKALDAHEAIGEALYGLGTVAQIRGDYDASSDAYEASLPHFRSIGAKRGLALSLSGLGLTLLYRGELDRAVANCEESVEAFEEVGDMRSLAGALTNLGIMALEQGDLQRAVRHCDESLTIRRRLGDRGGMAHTRTILGRIALRTGDLPRATAAYCDALALRQGTGEREGMIAPLEGLAAVAGAGGNVQRAARLFGAATALRARIGAPVPSIDRPITDRTIAAIRSQLDAEAFSAAWAQGESLSLDAAIAEATSPSADQGAIANSPAEPTPIEACRPSEPILHISSLGHTRVVRAGHELSAVDWTYSKAKEMLFFLLIQGPSTKEQIGLALWPDASAAQLSTTFHPTLHHLRRALGGSDWVVLAQNRYDVNRALPYTFDVERFTAAVTDAQRLTEHDQLGAMRLLEQAAADYRGRFLADSTDGEWFLPTQEKLQRVNLDALLLLGQLQFAHARYADAAETYRAAIAEDAYLESAHRELMRSYARMGERGLALRHFQAFANLLREELAATPALKTRALFERLRRGEDVE